MKFDLDRATTKLTKDSLIPLRNAAGTNVAVLWGKVWLTQEGDRKDYELRAGESFLIRAQGVTLIGALEDAAVSVLEPCRDGEPLRAAWTASTAPPLVSPQWGSDRYVSSEELESYKRQASELRTRYIGDLLTRFVRAVKRVVARRRDQSTTLSTEPRRNRWRDERDRLYLP